MSHGLNLLVMQSEIVNTAGSAVKKYENWDLENTSRALFCLYDIDTRYADKLVCAKIINLLFTHLPERDNILTPIIRVINRSDQDDRWKIAASINKKHKRDEIANKFKAILHFSSIGPTTTTTTTTTPAMATTPATTTTTEPITVSSDEKQTSTETVTSSSATAPYVTLASAGPTSSSTAEQLKWQLKELDQQIQADQYSEEEKKIAMADLQDTGVDDVPAQWRYALQRMVAACLRLKFDDPKLNLRVREEYTGTNNALKRGLYETELEWAKKVHQECKSSMWLCNLWRDRGMSDIDPEQIGKSFYRIFADRANLTQTEWLVWRSFDTTKFADVTERIVAKCREDTLMRPAEDQPELTAMTATKRERELPMRKTRIEGKYSETKQESTFASNEEEEPEEEDDDEEQVEKKTNKKLPKEKEMKAKQPEKEKRKSKPLVLTDKIFAIDTTDEQRKQEKVVDIAKLMDDHYAKLIAAITPQQQQSQTQSTTQQTQLPARTERQDVRQQQPDRRQAATQDQPVHWRNQQSDRPQRRGRCRFGADCHKADCNFDHPQPSEMNTASSSGGNICFQNPCFRRNCRYTHEPGQQISRNQKRSQPSPHQQSTSPMNSSSSQGRYNPNFNAFVQSPMGFNMSGFNPVFNPYAFNPPTQYPNQLQLTAPLPLSSTPTSNLLLTNSVQDTKVVPVLTTQIDSKNNQENCLRNYSGLDCDASLCNRRHGLADNKNTRFCTNLQKNEHCQYFYKPGGCRFRHKAVV